MSEEVLYKFNELLNTFGNKLPNHEQYPKQFEYYVKLYKYYQDRKKKSQELVPIDS